MVIHRLLPALFAADGFALKEIVSILVIQRYARRSRVSLCSDARETRGVGEVVLLAAPPRRPRGSTSVSAARGRGRCWPRVLAYGMTTRRWAAWDPQRGRAEVFTVRPISQTQHVAPARTTYGTALRHVEIRVLHSE
ncbi:hypothetical protein BHE74_00026054 [Ensete ventricosum]|nr:hypothetical protein GW17_00012501 [Ensete ventricosum]RWW66566.1 hypothetical protein BHE74_00026054 [Ensete ventricosum]